MNTDKIEVYSTYDNNFGTWNVMSMDNQCLFYGSIEELEAWMEENEDRYHEQLH